jgi:bacteriorhodopsin
MSNVAPLLIIFFAYTLLVGFIYLRNQSIGTIRGLFIMSIVCCALSLMALLPHYTVEKWPYSVIPCIFGVQIVVSFIRMKLQQHELDKFEEEHGY